MVMVAGIVFELVRSRCYTRAVAGGLDRLNKRLNGDVLGAVDGCLFAREVDARLNAFELVQAALDPSSAGGAGHPLELESHFVG